PGEGAEHGQRVAVWPDQADLDRVPVAVVVGHVAHVVGTAEGSAGLGKLLHGGSYRVAVQAQALADAVTGPVLAGLWWRVLEDRVRRLWRVGVALGGSDLADDGDADFFAGGCELGIAAGFGFGLADLAVSGDSVSEALLGGSVALAVVGAVAVGWHGLRYLMLWPLPCVGGCPSSRAGLFGSAVPLSNAAERFVDGHVAVGRVSAPLVPLRT